MTHSGVRVINVVQARLASSRFPGKALAELGGMSLVEWVGRRCHMSRATTEVVFAIPSVPSSAPLVRHLRDHGFRVHSGTAAEDDVLARVVQAALSMSADVVVRTCADRPLVDPDVIDCTVEAFLLGDRGDIAYSHQPDADNPWDLGFGVEVLARSTLEAIHRSASLLAHREHVTLFAYEDPSLHVRCVPPPRELAELMTGERRFDVDLPSDLERLRGILVGADHRITAAEVLRRADHSG